jgi:hypothetical protein
VPVEAQAVAREVETPQEDAADLGCDIKAEQAARKIPAESKRANSSDDERTSIYRGSHMGAHSHTPLH